MNELGEMRKESIKESGGKFVATINGDQWREKDIALAFSLVLYRPGGICNASELVFDVARLY